jgi:cytidyltransferase-like protein
LTIVAVSGGFDPLHVGHLDLFRRARSLGDKLLVIVNSDDFLVRKKGYYNMPLTDRLEIIGSLKVVDYVAPCIDEDDSVCQTLRALKPDIFANGGDRTKGKPEEEFVCTEIGCKTVFGLGKKIRSSSNYKRVV